MPPEFTPLTEIEPVSWHRRTRPNPLAQALAHSSPFPAFHQSARLAFWPTYCQDSYMNLILRLLRDKSGKVFTVPPLPGREPWNRQHAEPDFPDCPRRPIPEVPTSKSGA